MGRNSLCAKVKRERMSFSFLSLFVGVTLVLAGCGGIPRSGPVRQVSPAQAVTASAGVAAQPPIVGAQPKEIVEGFLVACQAGLDDDFSVARMYLHEGAASKWNPLVQVRIFPDSQNVATSVSDTGAVKASVGTLGTLDQSGAFTETANDAVATAEFSLAKNAQGEWRIVSLGDGIFLSEHLFNSLYTEAPLYFLSSGSKSLVVDLRYLPTRNFAVKAMQQLLAGPSEWLVDGAHTAIPEGTKLLESVAVVDGVAFVDLSSEALANSASQQEKMVTQIRRTLMTSASIKDVTIRVAGTPIETTNVPDISAYPYASYSLRVLSNGAPYAVDTQSLAPIADPSLFTDLGLESLAVGYTPDNSQMVALARSSSELVAVEGTGARTLLSGSDLVPPSYDSFGWVLTGEKANDGALVAVNPSTGAVQRIGVQWLENAQVRKLAVSRDGSRLVVVSQSSGSMEIAVAAIKRSSDGAPQGFGYPVEVGQKMVDARDISWMGASTIAVLGRADTGGELVLYAVRVGGPSRRLVSPHGATVQISSGRNEASIVTLTDQGVVYRREGEAWRTLVSDASSVAYPG